MDVKGCLEPTTVKVHDEERERVKRLKIDIFGEAVGTNK